MAAIADIRNGSRTGGDVGISGRHKKGGFQIEIKGIHTGSNKETPNELREDVRYENTSHMISKVTPMLKSSKKTFNTRRATGRGGGKHSEFNDHILVDCRGERKEVRDLAGKQSKPGLDQKKSMVLGKRPVNAKRTRNAGRHRSSVG